MVQDAAAENETHGEAGNYTECWDCDLGMDGVMPEEYHARDGAEKDYDKADDGPVFFNEGGHDDLLFWWWKVVLADSLDEFYYVDGTAYEAVEYHGFFASHEDWDGGDGECSNANEVPVVYYELMLRSPQGLTLCQAANYLCGLLREHGLAQGQALRKLPTA
jgi:hypothetical protein